MNDAKHLSWLLLGDFVFTFLLCLGPIPLQQPDCLNLHIVMTAPCRVKRLVFLQTKNPFLCMAKAILRTCNQIMRLSPIHIFFG